MNPHRLALTTVRTIRTAALTVCPCSGRLVLPAAFLPWAQVMRRAAQDARHRTALRRFASATRVSHN